MRMPTVAVKEAEKLAPSFQTLLENCPSPVATLFIHRSQSWRKGKVNCYWAGEVGTDPIYFYTNNQALWMLVNKRVWLTCNDNPDSQWVKYSLTAEGRAVWTRLVEAEAASSKSVKQT